MLSFAFLLGAIGVHVTLPHTKVTESCRHRPSSPRLQIVAAEDLTARPKIDATQQRNILLYYTYSFFLGFYIATGTTVLFERQLGLSFAQIFMLDAIYMLMFILFEIPSGALADLVGRRKTLLTGLAVLVIAAIATGNAQNFWHLFLTFFIWAMGFSLVSGASEALLYDGLKNEKLFHRVSGRALSSSVGGLALAGVVGPLLFAQHFRLPYFASAIPFAVAFVAMLFYREGPPARSQHFSLSNHVKQIREGARKALANRFILWSTAALALVFAVSYTFTSLYQPYLTQIGFSVTQFAFILPVMFLFEALGGAWSERIASWLGERTTFWANFLLLGISLIVLGFFASRFVVPVLLFYGFLQGFLRPLVSTYANRHIDSEYRATIISVQVMVSTVAASAVLFTFGFLTDRIGVIALAGVIGGLVLIVGIPLLLARPTAQSETEQRVAQR